MVLQEVNTSKDLDSLLLTVMHCSRSKGGPTRSVCYRLCLSLLKEES